MSDVRDTEHTVPDRWPETQQLILLALDDDLDVSWMAGAELLQRLKLDPLPISDGNRRRVFRRS